jgi:hypothetical protein
VAITLCPPRRARRASSSRRSASSSLITSSSSISGGRRAHGRAPRARPAAAPAAPGAAALRAVQRSSRPSRSERELVAVGAVAGEAALEVPSGAPRARPRAPRRRAARERGRYSSVASPLSPRSRRSGERLGGARTAAARSHQRDAVPRELRSQADSVARERAAGADPGEQRVALGEHPRGVGAARRRAQRPQRRDDLVEVGAAHGRGALDELEPVGQEDAHERPLGDVEQALDGRAVGVIRLGSPGARSRPSARGRPSPSRRADDDARRLRAEAHQLALVARPARAPVQPKYSASSRFVLPAPLGP